MARRAISKQSGGLQAQLIEAISPKVLCTVQVMLSKELLAEGAAFKELLTEADKIENMISRGVQPNLIPALQQDMDTCLAKAAAIRKGWCLNQRIMSAAGGKAQQSGSRLMWQEVAAISQLKMEIIENLPHVAQLPRPAEACGDMTVSFKLLDIESNFRQQIKAFDKAMKAGRYDAFQGIHKSLEAVLARLSKLEQSVAMAANPAPAVPLYATDGQATAGPHSDNTSSQTNAVGDIFSKGQPGAHFKAFMASLPELAQKNRRIELAVELIEDPLAYFSSGSEDSIEGKPGWAVVRKKAFAEWQEVQQKPHQQRRADRQMDALIREEEEEKQAQERRKEKAAVSVHHYCLWK